MGQAFTKWSLQHLVGDYFIFNFNKLFSYLLILKKQLLEFLDNECNGLICGEMLKIQFEYTQKKNWIAELQVIYEAGICV